nr:hypothetical protein [uncultured Campylobacter sp.]
MKLNLQILSCQDPHLENVNLESLRDSAKFNLHAVQQHLTRSGDGGGSASLR